MLRSYTPATQPVADILNDSQPKWWLQGCIDRRSTAPLRQSTALWAGGMLNTILIVDDDESTRTFLSTLLQGAGYGVVVAGGVKAGLQVLEETWVDLLVADVRLGDANGLQLIAMSRQSMPTIAITGFADPVIEAQARQFGATFLLKPFTSGSLLALVEKRLRRYTTHPYWVEKRKTPVSPPTSTRRHSNRHYFVAIVFACHNRIISTSDDNPSYCRS